MSLKKNLYSEVTHMLFFLKGGLRPRSRACTSHPVPSKGQASPLLGTWDLSDPSPSPALAFPATYSKSLESTPALGSRFLTFSPVQF